MTFVSEATTGCYTCCHLVKAGDGFLTAAPPVCPLGYKMSTFIRRYSRYLNEKAMSYRIAAVDFTKMKRG